MRKMLTYMRIVLAVYAACYFVANPIFLHIHEIDGETIVHSHPLKDVSHTSAQAKIIKHFNTSQTLEAEYFPLELSNEVYLAKINTKVAVHTCLSTSIHHVQRGPPVKL